MSRPITCSRRRVAGAALLAAAVLPLRAASAAGPLAPPPGRGAIEFLERRVQSDPDDYTAWDRLGGLYLQRLRETGLVDYLRLADRAADHALAAAPPGSDPAGLVLRVRARFAGHDFVTARDLAAKLAAAEPDKPGYHLLLADTLLELGDYAAAGREIACAAGLTDASIEVEIRRSRLAFLTGDPVAAREHMEAALATADGASGLPAETMAWCQWQLGELAFFAGDYAGSESHNRKALGAFPNYYRARGGLARALAAQGRTTDAIAAYEKAIETVPDPIFISALHDLYLAGNRRTDAATEVELMESLGKLAAAGGGGTPLYNRPLALFYANNGTRCAEAYAMAAREYESRKDVYGADAVAWTALQAGKLDAARVAAGEALKLGTKDPLLLYHAGMVAAATGERASAMALLKSALAISPQFDPLQAPKAAAALRSLASTTQPAAAGER